jgi:hypothetical protein
METDRQRDTMTMRGFFRHLLACYLALVLPYGGSVPFGGPIVEPTGSRRGRVRVGLFGYAAWVQATRYDNLYPYFLNGRVHADGPKNSILSKTSNLESQLQH